MKVGVGRTNKEIKVFGGGASEISIPLAEVRQLAIDMLRLAEIPHVIGDAPGEECGFDHDHDAILEDASKLCRDGGVEIDDSGFGPIFSCGESAGAYVMGWIWGSQPTCDGCGEKEHEGECKE
jgi:hypothetical protein